MECHRQRPEATEAVPSYDDREFYVRILSRTLNVLKVSWSPGISDSAFILNELTLVLAGRRHAFLNLE